METDCEPAHRSAGTINLALNPKIAPASRVIAVDTATDQTLARWVMEPSSGPQIGSIGYTGRPRLR